ncbi:MAG: hypothetical protein ABR907_09035 [Terracidiphilus sp.]|jgi:predicted nucleic acid-binding protein
MTLLFFDLNVWLALSVNSHPHNAIAWAWLNRLPGDDRLLFSRYTQLGLLRLLTNTAVMGDQTLTLSKAWDVYDRWLADPRVDFYPESRNLEAESARPPIPLPLNKPQSGLAIAGCVRLRRPARPNSLPSIGLCMSLPANRATPPSCQLEKPTRKRFFAATDRRLPRAVCRVEGQAQLGAMRDPTAREG